MPTRIQLNDYVLCQIFEGMSKQDRASDNSMDRVVSEKYDLDLRTVATLRTTESCSQKTLSKIVARMGEHAVSYSGSVLREPNAIIPAEPSFFVGDWWSYFVNKDDNRDGRLAWWEEKIEFKSLTTLSTRGGGQDPPVRGIFLKRRESHFRIVGPSCGRCELCACSMEHFQCISRILHAPEGRFLNRHVDWAQCNLAAICLPDGVIAKSR